jgi:hypothetical protein
MRILAANMLGHYQHDRKKKGGQQQGETTGNDSGGEEDTTGSEADLIQCWICIKSSVFFIE